MLIAVQLVGCAAWLLAGARNAGGGASSTNAKAVKR
jgi:hypothetical protein